MEIKNIIIEKIIQAIINWISVPFGTLAVYLFSKSDIFQQIMLNHKLSTFVLSLTFGILFLIFFIYFHFWLKENRIAKKLSKVLFVASIILIVLSFIVLFWYKPFHEDVFGILVTKFEEEGLKKDEKDLKNKIITDLRINFHSQIDKKEVEIKGWPFIILKYGDNNINKIGRLTKADIIIFGKVLRGSNKLSTDICLAIKNKYLTPEFKNSYRQFFEIQSDEKEYQKFKLPSTAENYINVSFQLSQMFIKLNQSKFDSAKSIVENLSGEIGDTLKHHFLGILYFNWAFKGDLSKIDSFLTLAESEFKLSIDIDEKYHNSYFSLGRIYFHRYYMGFGEKSNNISEAIFYFEKAWEERRENPNYIISLSIAYYEDKRYPDVIKLTKWVNDNSNVLELLSKEQQVILKENYDNANNALKKIKMNIP